MLFAAYYLNLIVLEHQNKYFGEKVVFRGKKKEGNNFFSMYIYKFSVTQIRFIFV